jgi:hypothetical protein
MTKKEFEQTIREIVEEVVREKIEEKVEAMFYKTLVESNFMSNVISTIYENVERSSPRPALKETLYHEPHEPEPETRVRPTQKPKALPEGLEPLGSYFEGTTPLESDNGGQLRTNALSEGLNPNLVDEDGVKLDAFAGLADVFKRTNFNK